MEIRHGIPWNRMDFCGIKRLHGLLWNTVEYSMGVHGPPRASMEAPWNSLGFYCPPWNSMELHGIHGIPWNF